VDRTPDPRNGHQSIVLDFEGPGAELLDNEAGGHRIQRIPITERGGRVHSSTVTVAVLAQSMVDSRYQRRNADDYVIEWYSGTVGAGGQNHQKTQNCARLTHLPTGIVRTAQTRSRQNSFKAARAAIDQELDRQNHQTANAAENAVRRAQVGSGQRSDKRRTVRFQDGLVHDHVTQKSVPINVYLKGYLEKLWTTD